MTENPEITELQNKIYTLEKDIGDLDSQIADIREQCDHKRVDYPGITNPWWCEKCGGPMPESTDQPEQTLDGNR